MTENVRWLAHQLIKDWSEHRRLVEVEPGLRCQRCGNKDSNTVRVPGAAPV